MSSDANFSCDDLASRIADLERENAQLREEAAGIASANVNAALQMVELSESRARDLEAKNDQIAVALRQAEQASEQKSAFLANMSHELRTPISGIFGLTELLAGSPLTGQQRTQVDAIAATAESFLELINQLLEFSKADSNQVTIERIEFDLWETIEDVAQLLQVHADQKGVEFAIDLDPDVPRRVLGDPLRIRQVLLNLGTNAVKFTDRGMVFMRAECTSLAGGRNALRVQFDDTGCGFTADAGERIFEPFVQADSSTTRRYGGTGLGLSICRHLVQRMDGDIYFESQPSIGSTFTLRVPLARAQPDEPSKNRGQRVRLVTSRPPTTTMIRKHLVRLGFEVEPAQAANPQTADLLVLEAPVNTRVALERLRMTDPNTPILLVTSPGPPISESELEACGAIGVLQRPLRATQIVSLLTEELEHSTTPAKSTHEGIRVLVAEDTAVNRHILVAQLERLGCIVQSATNGREAIERWRAAPFDLILMDCQMPVLDGYSATRTIRREESEGRIPIVALTANAAPKNYDFCIEAGMDEFCVKPLRGATLNTLLSRWAPSTSQQPPD